MIHIKRSSAFGDVLWVEPIARHFLSLNKVVNVITCFPDAFENYPDKNLLLNQPLSYTPVGTKIKSYIDLDMAYESRPKIHILDAYRIESCISNMELSYPKLYLTEEEKKPYFSENYVVLHLEKNILNFRNVYGVDWNQIVKHLKEMGLEVLAISNTEKNTFGTWVKTDNFRKVMSLIYHSKFFIGLDSGPSHIAAALGIPSLIFFGSVNPVFRHLKSFKGMFLQGGCEFAHCYHETVSTFGQVCKLVGSHGMPKCCIQPTEKVIEAIDQLIYTY